jgi:ribosomal protein S18 acetylase RimI-like enzyme
MMTEANQGEKMNREEEITIRRAEPGDEAGMAFVHVASWRAAYQGLVPQEALDQLSVRTRSAQWRRVLEGQAPDQFAYVACDAAHEVVGFANGGPERGEVPGYDSEVHAIYLLPDVQRRGIGRRLLVEVAEELTERGYRSLAVWVLADNPARAFYTALGGLPVAEKRIEIGGVSLPEVAYGWDRLGDLANRVNRLNGVKRANGLNGANGARPSG